MFAVCVTFQVSPDDMSTFMPLMLSNAKTSRDTEAGCRRFDVLTDPARPGDVFLYELYTNEEAFQLHLGSIHFKAFDQAVSSMIKSKNIRTYSELAQ